jgi:hypothetical protein
LPCKIPSTDTLVVYPERFLPCFQSPTALSRLSPHPTRWPPFSLPFHSISGSSVLLCCASFPLLSLSILQLPAALSFSPLGVSSSSNSTILILRFTVVHCLVYVRPSVHIAAPRLELDTSKWLMTAPSTNSRSTHIVLPRLWRCPASQPNHRPHLRIHTQSRRAPPAVPRQRLRLE